MDASTGEFVKADTRGTFTFGERLGLSFIVIAACVSLVAVLWLLTKLTVRRNRSISSFRLRRVLTSGTVRFACAVAKKDASMATPDIPSILFYDMLGLDPCYWFVAFSSSLPTMTDIYQGRYCISDG
jgi:hypothetical protein